MTDSFPRLHARTRRFTLGAPRGFTVSPDGARVVFLRSRGGTDPVTCLWTLDAGTGEERLRRRPARAVTGRRSENLPPEERARRERSREQAGGVVGYATDRPVTMAAFALSGRLYVADARRRTRRRALLDTARRAVDRPAAGPAGPRVAFVTGGALHVHDVATGETTDAAPSRTAEHVTYGLADFVAAEEMDRMRGYWWSPGRRRAAGRAGRRDPGAALAHRRPRQPRPHADRRSPTRPPAPRTPGSALQIVAPGRRPRRRSAGTPSATSTWSPRVLGRPRAARRRAAPRPAGAAHAARSTRPTGATHAAARATPTRPGSTSCRACRRAPRPGALVHGRRPRRRAPAGRRRRAGHAAATAGPRRARRRRRHGAVPRAAPTRARSGCGPGTPGRADRCVTPEPGVHTGPAGAAARWSSPRPDLDTDGATTTVRRAGDGTEVTDRLAAPTRPACTRASRCCTCGRAGAADRAAAALVARAGHAAAGADGPLRRPARPAGARRPRRRT